MSDGAVARQSASAHLARGSLFPPGAYGPLPPI